MDLKRREFIKLLTAAVVSVGLNPLEGIAVENDLYSNRRIGLTCHKPSKWKFDSIADFAALRERQVLNSIVTDEKHPLKDPENLPVFIMIDCYHQRGDFAPSISLWDEPLHSGVPSDEIKAHRRMIESGFALSYRDVKLISKPSRINVVGANATDSVWQYRHILDDGQNWLLKVRSILIFRVPRVHTYHLVDDIGHNFVPKSVFDDFIASIKYKQ